MTLNDLLATIGQLAPERLTPSYGKLLEFEFNDLPDDIDLIQVIYYFGVMIQARIEFDDFQAEYRLENKAIKDILEHGKDPCCRVISLLLNTELRLMEKTAIIRTLAEQFRMVAIDCKNTGLSLIAIKLAFLEHSPSLQKFCRLAWGEGTFVTAIQPILIENNPFAFGLDPRIIKSTAVYSELHRLLPQNPNGYSKNDTRTLLKIMSLREEWNNTAFTLADRTPGQQNNHRSTRGVLIPELITPPKKISDEKPMPPPDPKKIPNKRRIFLPDPVGRLLSNKNFFSGSTNSVKTVESALETRFQKLKSQLEDPNLRQHLEFSLVGSLIPIHKAVPNFEAIAPLATRSNNRLPSAEKLEQLISPPEFDWSSSSEAYTDLALIILESDRLFDTGQKQDYPEYRQTIASELRLLNEMTGSPRGFFTDLEVNYLIWRSNVWKAMGNILQEECLPSESHQPSGPQF